MTYLFFLLPSLLFAKVDISPRNSRAIKFEEPVKQTVKVRQSSMNKIVESPIEARSRSEIEEYIAKAEMKAAILDFTSTTDIKTGTVLKGILQNSVLSTNLDSPVLVDLLPNKYLPDGSRVVCRGITKHSRIQVQCSRLITGGDTGDEFEISAKALNLDGTDGLKPDEISNPDEKFFVGEIFKQGMKSATTMGQALQETAIGELPIANTKNRLINGLGGAIDTSSNISAKKMQTLESKALIISGKTIFIYFEERFRL